MNLQESIKKILREEVTEDKNLYGEKLRVCSTKPMTGFYRDGYCKTGDDDTGSHTVCARVTEEFLEFTKSMGNNLDMLEPGDKWCLCAKRWEEANKEGVAPEMIKSSTNIKTLDIIDSDEQELDEYARTLKNARRQGVGLRFPKSAVKANPQRFRKYTRDNIKESDPKTGTGKKPEGSGRRLYTDENPNDTVSVKFRTKQDIIDTLNKDSFKSKPHKRQSQIINLIHQRVRAAYQNAKDPEVKQRLKKGYDYITNVKEKSKQKTIKLQKQKVNESDESRQERKFTKLLNNIEEYINSNSYNSVVRVMVDYDEVMDDVIVNIFFDAEHAVKLGGGINSVIKRSGKKIMEDLSVFPFDFKYHIHFEKPQLNESRTNSSLNNLLNMLFDGFDDIYYDWANYMCGMGECCDPYAIGFTLPKNHYDDYIFKLVDSVKYDDDGDYPKELRDELPEVCYESPDLKNPDFDTIVFYGLYAEEIEDYMGPESNWRSDLLKIINKKFGCEAKQIIII